MKISSQTLWAVMDGQSMDGRKREKEGESRRKKVGRWRHRDPGHTERWKRKKFSRPDDRLTVFSSTRRTQREKESNSRQGTVSGVSFFDSPWVLYSV